MEETQLSAYAEAGVDLFLLDRVGEGRLGSTGRQIEDETLVAFRQLLPPRPWLIAGGIDSASVRARLELSGAVGVDVFSSVRDGGRVDASRVAALVAAARGEAT
jgi:phosphoribosylanthranilate isomerase